MKAAQSCPSLCDLKDYTVHGILQVRILECVAFPFSMGSSQPRDWTQVSCISGRFFTSWDSLPAEPQGNHKNTGVGSLSLLQQIFPTQELNWGLLLCRWILYQLSYHGSPWDSSSYLQEISQFKAELSIVTLLPYLPTFHPNLSLPLCL